MKALEQISFEGALKRLEEIVSLLNSGNAPLDESLALFEEGTALVRLCTARLDQAEKQVKILTTQTDGSLTEQDFDPKNPKG